MQPLIWDRRPDGLRAPAMVCAFQGWNDAGDAASSAVSFLATSLDARRFARIDSEEFFDFQANRPCIASTTMREREISWPTVEIFEARAPRAPRDLVLVQGVEPSMRWRAFGAHLVDLAEALGVQVVVSLGALLGDVPHTRPVAMTGHASDAALLERLGLPPPSYEGPTGIVGVLHTRLRATPGCRRRACGPRSPTTSPRPTNPKAALALLRRVEVLIGVSVDVSELESAAADYERQVGLAVQSDPDIQAFVERLEQAADERGRPAAEDVPSGDALAREFQRFLRQRGREEQQPQRRARPPGLASSRRRAHDPVVADRAGGRARASARSAARGCPRRPPARPPRPRSRRGSRGHRDLEVVEHVVVGLARGLEPPVLARGERVQRQLHVLGELLGALRARGLVVDQLVVAAVARRRGGRRGRRARAGGAGRAGRRTGARTTPARRPARAGARGSASSASRAFASSSPLRARCRRSRARRQPASSSSSICSSVCAAVGSGSARAPGARRCRSAGAASARWGCAARARTCSAAGSCGRSRCPTPTAPGRRPCAAGTARASAPRARAIAARRAELALAAEQRLVERRGLQDLALQRRRRPRAGGR